MERPRILFVDDDTLMRSNTEAVLRDVYGDDLQFEPEFHFHPQIALNSIRKNPFNVCAVFLDEQIWETKEKRISGSSYIPEIKAINPYIKVVMVSGDTSEGTLDQWIKAKADNYLYKAEDGASQKITIFINDATEQFNAKFGDLLGTRQSNRFRVPESLRKINLISTSPKMESLAELVNKAATSALEPVIMLIGESGTGKELLAQAVHNLSRRSKETFKIVDCTHFKDSDIVGSELFGSEKGAFTGSESRPGLLEQADGGTVFIDEVHRLGEKAQGMLLRFLQDQVVRRVGGKTERKVNVRIIVAGQPVFHEMVSRGEFLPDLAFRMKQVVIQVPPLRERENDIEVLAYHYLDKVNEVTKLNQRIHPDLVEVLKRHSWPGNVRELKSAIERVCSIVQEPVLLPGHLLNIAGFEIDEKSAFVPGKLTIPKLKDSQRNEMIGVILKTYQSVEFNLAETARLLDVPRSTLRELCRSLGIADAMKVDCTRQERKNKSQFKEAFERYAKLIFAMKEC